MDNTTTQILSIVAIVSAVGGTVVTYLNRLRIVSTCCGRKLTASFIMDHTAHTPKESPEVTSSLFSPLLQ